MQKMTVTVDKQSVFDASNTGEYEAEASVTNSGELLVTLKRIQPHPEQPGGAVVSNPVEVIGVRFNRMVTQQIRTVLRHTE